MCEDYARLRRARTAGLAKYPYRYYHTPYDTPQRLDYEDARYHTAIGGTMAWRLAMGPDQGAGV